ncbi:hypothetical protein P3W85_30055 [Cupriavidus basilensis]|uniref:Chromosome partition protein Smc n=1 Tax=Cupriavidus basilensis TaxID=68895 RepID=A0ABT6AX54_9BURK|nr:hypothetical protein [Cupriavidus basilensis]MDF3837168.1 hypothetical protein [Cupriavidus basilensis]
MTQSPVLDRLIQDREIWDGFYDELPSEIPGSYGLPIPKESYPEWWDAIISGVALFEQNQLDPAIKSALSSEVYDGCNKIAAYMKEVAANGALWLQQNAHELHTAMWIIRRALFFIFTPRFNHGQIVDPQKISDLLNIPRELQKIHSEALSEIAKYEKLADESRKQIQEIKQELSRIEGYERTANTAQTNAKASAAAAQEEKNKAEQILQKLQDGMTQQQRLFAELKEQRDKIEGTLQGASKIALAKSFNTRKSTLQTTQIIWGVIFVLGIATLVLVSMSIWDGMIIAITKNPPHQGAAGNTLAFWLNISRYLVIMPIIWLTWFAARQYGHTLRLGEDYAFKEAAAHAFVGYRAEMGDDTEMIKLLREYAIKNFGANPMRVIKDDEPESPFNAVLSQAIDKISPDKLLDLLREALANGKK